MVNSSKLTAANRGGRVSAAAHVVAAGVVLAHDHHARPGELGPRNALHLGAAVREALRRIDGHVVGQEARSTDVDAQLA